VTLPMLKLTRLDHRVVAINPDHIAWVEATPDTTLCLLGDRKIIVRESVDEVCERFVVARSRLGCSSPLGIQPGPMTGSRRPGSPSGRPPGPHARSSVFPPAPAPVVIEDIPDSKSPYRNSRFPHGVGGE
jgi:flagellar protein FlbD